MPPGRVLQHCFSLLTQCSSQQGSGSMTWLSCPQGWIIHTHTKRVSSTVMSSGVTGPTLPCGAAGKGGAISPTLMFGDGSPLCPGHLTTQEWQYQVSCIHSQEVNAPMPLPPGPDLLWCLGEVRVRWSEVKPALRRAAGASKCPDQFSTAFGHLCGPSSLPDQVVCMVSSGNRSQGQ